MKQEIRTKSSKTVRAVHIAPHVTPAEHAQNTFKGIIADIYHNAIIIGKPHCEILQELETKVFSQDNYRRAPTDVKAYLRGFNHALFESMYRAHLEWRLYVEGELLSRKDVEARMMKDKDFYRKVDTDLCRHTYIGRPDRPF